MGKIDYCVLKNDDEFIEYEKSLYKAYSKKNPNGWLSKNYQVIDGNRYKSKYPYSDQLIYAAVKDNKIISAIAFNINKNKLLLEEIGFKLSIEEKQKKICEGLTFHLSDEFGIEIMNVFEILSNFVSEDLKNKEYKAIYGSCSEKLKRLYLKDGFIILKDIIFNNEKEYLIKKEIK